MTIISLAVIPTQAGSGLQVQTVAEKTPGVFLPNDDYLNSEVRTDVEPDAVPASVPEYRNPQRDNLEDNLLLMTFDTLSSSAQVNGTYNWVTFSPGYTALDNSGSLKFPPFSGSMVAFSNEVMNNISFTKNAERFVARFSTDVEYYIHVDAYDTTWNLVTSEVILPNARNQEVKLYMPGKTFSHIRVSGPSGFETHWTVDSIEVVFKNRNLITFDDLLPSSPVPEYTLITIPQNSKFVESTGAGGASGVLGVEIPLENLVRFLYPVSYIQFFTSTTEEIQVTFLSENQKVETTIIPTNSTMELVSYTGKIDSFILESKTTGTWVMDDIYFEIEPEPPMTFDVEFQVDGLNLDTSDPRVDTIEMQATVNFSNVVFGRVEIDFEVYSGGSENLSLVTSFSEATWVSGSGEYNTSVYRYTVEVEGNYTVFYREFTPAKEQHSKSVFHAHAYGSPIFTVETKETDLVVYDFDNDTYDDSLSIDLNLSYFNALKSNITVIAVVGRDKIIQNARTLVKNPGFPVTYSYKTVMRLIKGGGIVDNTTYEETVSGSGNFFETYEYFNDWLIQGSTYFAYFFFVVDGVEIGRLTYTVALYRRVLGNISVNDGIEFSDFDGDGFFDSFAINVNVTYKKTDIGFHYLVDVFTAEEQVKIEPARVASFEILAHLNGTGQIFRSFSLQLNKTGTYKVNIQAFVPKRSAVNSGTTVGNFGGGIIEFDTPLSFWLNGVPLLLDGVGDNPPEINLNSSQVSSPLPLFAGIVSLVVLTLWRKRKD